LHNKLYKYLYRIQQNITIFAPIFPYLFNYLTLLTKKEIITIRIIILNAWWETMCDSLAVPATVKTNV